MKREKDSGYCRLLSGLSWRFPAGRFANRSGGRGKTPGGGGRLSGFGKNARLQIMNRVVLPPSVKNLFCQITLPDLSSIIKKAEIRSPRSSLNTKCRRQAWPPGKKAGVYLDGKDEERGDSRQLVCADDYAATEYDSYTFTCMGHGYLQAGCVLQ